jgi:hypothetical protein
MARVSIWTWRWRGEAGEAGGEAWRHTRIVLRLLARHCESRSRFGNLLLSAGSCTTREMEMEKKKKESSRRIGGQWFEAELLAAVAGKCPALSCRAKGSMMSSPNKEQSSQGSDAVLRRCAEAMTEDGV